MSLVESSSESSNDDDDDECDLLVQRLSGKGGNSSAVIKLVAIQDAGEGNVCSETTANGLHIKDDLNLDTPYIHVSWSDQDASDRCLNFDAMDDAIVEGDEVICVQIERVEGTAKISETGNRYALLTLGDNDKAYDNTLIIVLSVVAFILLGIVVFAYIRRQSIVSKYIKIKYAVEVSKCRYFFITFTPLSLSLSLCLFLCTHQPQS